MWGYSSESLRHHRKHVATGVLLHMSRDRGYVGRVTIGFRKGVFWKRGLFRKVVFLEILENLELLEILEIFREPPDCGK